MDDLGTVRPVEEGWELRFERRYPHPVEAVWASLTDPAETPAWWGELEGDLRLGGTYVMRWAEGRAVMQGTITAFDPPRLLETSGDAVHGRLRWELTPDGDGTALVFTSTVAAAPDDGVEGFSRGLAGWHWHMDALGVSLGGGRAEASMEGWEAARQRYLALLA